LTPSEKRLSELWLAGATNEEIRKQLGGIQPRTVTNKVSKLRKKCPEAVPYRRGDKLK
jgi:DNA-binding CsgD family transcriptional regulator